MVFSMDDVAFYPVFRKDRGKEADSWTEEAKRLNTVDVITFAIIAENLYH